MEFLLTWANYLKHQRVPPPAGFEHPYAFTNSVGNPETLKNFQRLHAAAVCRIGLISKKYLGTTEHGHRHSYGYRLSENGFSQIDIQKSLHHKDPQSSYVYTQPTSEDLREKMKRTE
ncbi:Phage integrase family protein [compost metagenome]